uniref:Transmembrane protein n=1 Tax=Peronospora matthiolae TaxID=2874970 RepID=A0AAV1V058_9STRA
MFMETVSLNDDAPERPSSTVMDADALEAKVVQIAAGKSHKGPHSAAVSVSASRENQIEDGRGSFSSDSEYSRVNGSRVEGFIAVDVDGTGSMAQDRTEMKAKHKQELVLPPLRVLTPKVLDEDRDYVDATLFSPEVSRHAMEVAHRRAEAIASEVKELIDVEVELTGPPKAKLSPAEAVSIISGAFASSIQRAKQLVKPGTKEYDLLAGSSPSATMSKLDDLDADGDGLQLSPEAMQSSGNQFCRQQLRPALKRLSAYSTAAALEPDKKVVGTPAQKKKIIWHEDVLDADEEFCEDDSCEQEMRSLKGDDEEAGRTPGSGSPRSQLLNMNPKTGEHETPQGRKKRKKIVRSMMRRLTPREKEELYRQRPDLMIVPNWAQKYREDLAGEDTTRCNTGLLGLITALAVLLLVFVFFIVRQRAAATAT